jgi:hypothetical protein
MSASPWVSASHAFLSRETQTFPGKHGPQPSPELQQSIWSRPWVEGAARARGEHLLQGQGKQPASDQKVTDQLGLCPCAFSSSVTRDGGRYRLPCVLLSCSPFYWRQQPSPPSQDLGSCCCSRHLNLGPAGHRQPQALRRSAWGGRVTQTVAPFVTHIASPTHSDSTGVTGVMRGAWGVGRLGLGPAPPSTSAPGTPSLDSRARSPDPVLSIGLMVTQRRVFLISLGPPVSLPSHLPQSPCAMSSWTLGAGPQE